MATVTNQTLVWVVRSYKYGSPFLPVAFSDPFQSQIHTYTFNSSRGFTFIYIGKRPFTNLLPLFPYAQIK